MPPAASKKIWTRILTAILIIIALVLIGNVVIKQLITRKFDTAIQAFAPVADIQYKAIHINLLSASFQIDSLAVSYHPSLTLKDHRHSVQISRISLSGINYFTLISGKKLSASALRVDHMTAILDEDLFNTKDSILPTLLDSIKPPFENIILHTVEISNASLKIKNGNIQSNLADGDITINNINIPNTNNGLDTGSIAFESIACKLHDINYTLRHYHKVQVAHCMIDSRDSILQIDSIKIIPLLDKFALGQKLGYQADHINTFISGITVKGFDLMQLRKKKLVAASLNIGHSNTHVFRDRRLQRKMEKQPMSIDFLKQIPLTVNIGRFSLNDATVTSEEFPKEGDKTGYITITGIDVSIQPFYNKPYNGHNELKAKVKGNIMSAGIIQATIDLSLLTGNERINGSIEQLKLTALNPSAENMGQFHIESGVLDFLSFSFIATHEKASGKIVGEYHDLVIDKLKYTKDGLKKAKLPSFALRAIVIPKNKDASLPVRRRNGIIDFDRDPTRFITFFYIKALLDGIRNSFALGFVLPE